ncbi:MAG: DUF2058 family protein [Bdellovibrionota bacterium]
MSLKDQLLKAGLVTKKQAQQTEANKRKQEHDSKRNVELAQKLSQEKQKELELIEEEKRKRQELDKELNKKRDALILQRENVYRAVQSINSNSLNTREANEKYFFAENNFVRAVYVTPWQREMLARGKFAIAKPYEDIREYVIIPLVTAKLLQDIYPQKLIVLHSIIEDDVELDL